MDKRLLGPRQRTDSSPVPSSRRISPEAIILGQGGNFLPVKPSASKDSRDAFTLRVLVALASKILEADGD
jgi:hypothetical protein